MATKATAQLLMPEMGESVTEGTVLEWLVTEGDPVEEGQTMVEVSTDKVDAEVPAPASGTVTKIIVQVDEEVDVGKLKEMVHVKDEDIDKLDQFVVPQGSTK